MIPPSESILILNWNR